MTKKDLGGRLAWASNHISTSLHYFTTLDPATPPPTPHRSSSHLHGDNCKWCQYSDVYKMMEAEDITQPDPKKYFSHMDVVLC